jgi:hypothetical protein
MAFVVGFCNVSLASDEQAIKQPASSNTEIRTMGFLFIVRLKLQIN